MNSISLTDKATSELRRIIQSQQSTEPVAIRLSVKDGGCSGFSYVMGVDEGAAEDTDVVIEDEGISIFVDDKSMSQLDGMTVDFHEDLMQRGFVFKNPNSTGTCGCGQSFSA